MERIILIVDDEPSILRSLKRVLRQSWTVLQAESGAQALCLLEQYPVSVLLSDYRMPEMNGIDLMNRVKADFPHIQRYLLSGQADYALVSDAINSGACHRILAKPWQEQHLLNHLDGAFRACRSPASAAKAEFMRPAQRLLADRELGLLYAITGNSCLPRVQFCLSHGALIPLKLARIATTPGDAELLQRWAETSLATILQLEFGRRADDIDTEFISEPVPGTNWLSWQAFRPALTALLKPGETETEFPIL